MMHFDCAFIMKLNPYFEDLKDCLTSMYNTIFATKNFWENTTDYPTVLRILQETYNKLPDKGPASNKVPSQASSSKGVLLSMCGALKSGPHLLRASGHSGGSKQIVHGEMVDSRLGSLGNSQSSKKKWHWPVICDRCCSKVNLVLSNICIYHVTTYFYPQSNHILNKHGG